MEGDLKDFSNFRSNVSYVEHLYRLIDEDMEKLSEKPAVIEHTSGRSITYSELKCQMLSTASALTKRGFGRGQFLSLYCTNNCIENIPIAHGTMATGGTLHLVKHKASSKELIAHMTKVMPRFIVTSADMANEILSVVQQAGISVEDIFVVGGSHPACSSVQDLLTDTGDKNPIGKVEIDPASDTAVLLPTGGTSGIAKLVTNTHELLIFCLKQAPKPKLPDGLELKFLSFQPFNYATGILLAFGMYLTWGMTVVSMPTFDPDEVLKAIEKHRPTQTMLTPATLSAMINSPVFDESDLSSLMPCPCSGAPLPKCTQDVIVNKLKAKAPVFDLIQTYGMNEVLTGVAVMPPAHLRPANKEGSVGQPKSNVEVRIMRIDGSGTECDRGEAGEVRVKGPLYSRYFRDEERNENAFINGWYHTGDYGWFDEDNYLYIADRVDDLLFVDNKQVAPSEIEQIIRSHDEVSDCIVVGKKEGGVDLPLAFVIKKASLSAEEIQEFMKEKALPHQQLKGGVRFVDNLPRSPAGKLLRKDLMHLI